MSKGIHRSISGILLFALTGPTAASPVLATPAIATSPIASPSVAPTAMPPAAPATTPAFPLAPALAPVPALPSAPPQALNTIPTPSLPSPAGLASSNSYTLGAGDLVRVDIFNTPELILENRYGVLLDGTLNLPWVGSASVQGMTLKQASEALSTQYSRFIRNPIVTVSLIAPRPLRIGIIGAVNRPGSYIISVIGNETSQSSLSASSSAGEAGSQWPTVSKAIQTAGGIAQLANIRQIQLRRPQPNGQQDLITVDLWRYLNNGELNQDLLLRDGDVITVPVATNIDPTEATTVATSNFSPQQIQVNVVGEVIRPGAVAIRPNSTLTQAILAAGGVNPARGRRTKIELIRLNPDGTVTKRDFKLNLAKGLSDEENPAVHNNDVIVVNRSNTAKVSDVLNAVLSPVTGAFGLLRLLTGGN
jgi:polysaccharide biosynthesis/export protein